MRVAACIAVAAILASSAPAAASPPEAAYITARPGAMAVTSRSIFDPSLRCLDELIARMQPNKNVPLALVVQETNNGLGLGAPSFVLSATARTNDKSRLFNIYPRPDASLEANPRLIVLNMTVAATDNTVQSKGMGGGVSLGPISFGYNKRKVDSLVTVAVYLADNKGVFLPGTEQTLTMVLHSESSAPDVSASIGGFGGNIEADFARNDGPAQAVHALVDLAVLQVVAAYANVPAARCLTLYSEQRQQRRAFDKLKSNRVVSDIARGLAALGYYRGEPVSTMSEDLVVAAQTFQSQRGDPPIGKPDFELWAAVQAPPALAAVPPPTASALPPRRRPPVADVAAAAPLPPQPIGRQPYVRISPHTMHLVTAGTNDNAFYIEQGYRAEFTVTLSAPGHVACFETDSLRRTTQVYPTAASNDRVLRPGDQLFIPGPQDRFSIEMPRLGPSFMTCVAAAETILLPESIRVDPRMPARPLAATTPRALLAELRSVGNTRLSADTMVLMTVQNISAPGVIPPKAMTDIAN